MEQFWSTCQAKVSCRAKFLHIKFAPQTMSATNMMYASTIVQYCSIAEQYLTDSCFWCLTLCGLFSCGTFFEWMKIVVADMHFCWCGVLDNWKLSKYKKFSRVLSWDTHVKTHRLAVYMYIYYLFIFEFTVFCFYLFHLLR